MIYSPENIISITVLCFAHTTHKHKVHRFLYLILTEPTDLIKALDKRVVNNLKNL